LTQINEPRDFSAYKFHTSDWRFLSMSDTRDKRRYRNTLEFIQDGFRACWRNASDLVAASENLIDQGLHGPGLSLAVLALEELGKLCAIDGLTHRNAGTSSGTQAMFERDWNPL
jgi:hypothetical protein